MAALHRFVPGFPDLAASQAAEVLAKVDPTTLVAPGILLFASVLALLGVLGKYVSGYGAGKGLRSAVVGWGMVPRGEVGLTFVAAGSALMLRGQALLSPELQAGIVGALLLTTIAGPMGLGWVLRRTASQS